MLRKQGDKQGLGIPVLKFWFRANDLKDLCKIGMTPKLKVRIDFFVSDRSCKSETDEAKYVVLAPRNERSSALHIKVSSSDSFSTNKLHIQRRSVHNGLLGHQRPVATFAPR